MAYVQFVRRHHEVCGAVMELREVMKGESMAQRIVMYPREWDEEEGTSKRLLRKAAKESKVMLWPVDAVQQREGAEANLTSEERFPLLNVMSLINYNRILLLQQPGLILDPTPLDLLFTLPMETPMLGLSDPQDERRQPIILLLEPSKETYQEMASTLPEGAYPDTEFLQKIPVEPAPEDPEKRVHLLAKTSLLEKEDSATFNATDFMDMTAYVQFSDAGLPGPEFDISRRDFVRAMPGEGEMKKAWEGVYEKFRDARMDVCGLDLEPVEITGNNIAVADNGDLK